MKFKSTLILTAMLASVPAFATTDSGEPQHEIVALAIGHVGLPGIATVAIVDDELEEFGGRRSKSKSSKQRNEKVLKSAKKVASAIGKATPTLTKVGKSGAAIASVVTNIPTVRLAATALSVGVPAASFVGWHIGSAISKVENGHGAGPWPGVGR